MVTARPRRVSSSGAPTAARRTEWHRVPRSSRPGSSTTAVAVSATAMHLAFQWLLDPDDDPATADAPRVVNGSWVLGAGPSCNLTFQPDVRALALGRHPAGVLGRQLRPVRVDQREPGELPRVAVRRRGRCQRRGLGLLERRAVDLRRPHPGLPGPRRTRRLGARRPTGSAATSSSPARRSPRRTSPAPQRCCRGRTRTCRSPPWRAALTSIGGRPRTDRTGRPVRPGPRRRARRRRVGVIGARLLGVGEHRSC